jgi:hypothetical protein
MHPCTRHLFQQIKKPVFIRCNHNTPTHDSCQYGTSNEVPGLERVSSRTKKRYFRRNRIGSFRVMRFPHHELDEATVCGSTIIGNLRDVLPHLQVFCWCMTAAPRSLKKNKGAKIRSRCIVVPYYCISFWQGLIATKLHIYLEPNRTFCKMEKELTALKLCHLAITSRKLHQFLLLYHMLQTVT